MAVSITVTADPRTGNSEPAVTRPAGCVAYPKFVIQHTWAAHHRVVPVDPRFNNRAVEGGADLTWDAAVALRDRLNAAAGRVAA